MNLRLWPGVAIAALMVLTRLIASIVPDGTLLAVLGPLAGGPVSPDSVTGRYRLPA